ncbi:MAG: ABC transporter permease [Chloroflexi bacterium]|nr:ABC transporter permease [Chloroflexota bacterium]
MLQYFLRRLVLTIPTLLVVSVISFTLIQLPPGDYLTSYMAARAAQGEMMDQAAIDAMTRQYGLDQPMYMQYLRWLGKAVRGDFGQSFLWNRPVSELIWERLGLTVAISLAALLFVWAVAFPVSVYAATHQYSFGDHLFSFFGFIGLGFPDFMVALILLWIGYRYFDTNLGGLFSDAFIEAPWGWPKFLDMLKHLWVPMVVLGMGGTAGLIRTTRANLLDELHKPYVTTARAKGLTETKLLFKYPVRVALKPFFATLGWQLPNLVSGATVIAVVLSLPTTGPLYLQALLTQDMFLAGTIVMMLSALTVIGTLLSDILLVLVDPRIRYGGG